MPPSTSHERPLRPCVGIALFNAQGGVWVGRRVGDDGEHRSDYRWQLPQGGIDPGEPPHDTVFRELYEETGARNARIVAEIDEWLTYEFPQEVIETHRKRNRGQTQKWFGLLFTGEESEFDLTVHEPEFDAWRWAALSEIPDLVIPFKRQVYEVVADRFAPLAARLARGEPV